MPDPGEEFGAGLPIPAEQQPTAAVPNPPVDDAWSQLRSKFDGLPADLTQDDFVTAVLDLQAKATEADSLRQRIAEFETQTAMQAAQQQKPATPEAKPSEEEFEFPYRPVRVDPALKNLVKIDPQSGMYVPTNAASIAHIKAAEEMNARREYEARLVNDLLDDPEAFGATLSKRQIANLKKEFDARINEVVQEIKPVKDFVGAQQSQRSINDFCDKNYDTLFDAQGQMTPVGKIVDGLMREDGLQPEAALKRALASAELFGIQSTRKPEQKPSLSISKVKTGEEKNRFIDRISHQTQAIVDTPASESNGKRYMTERDLKDKYKIPLSN